MLATIDTIIAIALVYMILSMANKFLMSFFKRAIKLKPRAVSKVLGKLVFTDLSGYLSKNNIKLGFIDSVSGLGGFDKKDIAPAIEAAKNIETFIKKKDPDEIAALLGLDTSALNPSSIRFKATEFRDAIEAKYASAMEQVTETYTRNLRYWTIIFGLFIAVAVNADFFTIYSSISDDAQLRKKLVAYAEVIDEDITEKNKKLEEMEKKFNEASPDERAGMITGGDEFKEIQLMTKPLEDSGLKLGWTMKEWKDDTLSSGWLFLKKLLGLSVSGLLIGFGAPFWHDLLRSVAGIKTVLNKRGKGEGLKVSEDE